MSIVSRSEHKRTVSDLRYSVQYDMGCGTPDIVQHGNVYGSARIDGVRDGYKGEEKMKIAIIALIIFLTLLCYSLCVASSTADRDAHEAYQRWKERKRNERSD